MDNRETNSDHEIDKKIICKYSLFKKCLRQLFFLLLGRLKTNCLDVCVYKVVVGVDLINDLLRKSGGRGGGFV